MSGWKRSGILTALAVIVSCNAALASDSTSNKYPSVILVQLKSEQNRIKALSRPNQHAELEEVLKDAKRVREVTINDFRDHFTYCPVYYFIDTNIEAIKNKQFEGVLLNADLSVAQSPLINQNSKDYLIMYYGYPSAQKRSGPQSSDMIDENVGQRLVLLDDQYKQITYLSLPVMNDGTNIKTWKKKYAYNSKHFDIKYVPLAYAYQYSKQPNRAIKKYIRKKRRRHTN